MKKQLIVLLICNSFVRADMLSRFSPSHGAYIAYEQQDFAKAQSGYEALVEKNPYDPVANYNIGTALYKQKKFDQARDAFERSIKHAGDDMRLLEQSLFNQGNSHMQMSEYQRAIDAYQKALDINPDNERTQKNLQIARDLLEEQKRKEQEQKNQDKDKKEQDKKKDKEEQKKDQQKDKQDKNDQQKDQDKKDQNEQNKQDEQDKKNKQDQGDRDQEQNQDSGQDEGGKQGDNKKEQESKQDSQKQDKSSTEGAQSSDKDPRNQNQQQQQKSGQNKLGDDKQPESQGKEKDLKKSKEQEKSKTEGSQSSDSDPANYTQESGKEKQAGAQEGGKEAGLQDQYAQAMNAQAGADDRLNKKEARVMQLMSEQEDAIQKALLKMNVAKQGAGKNEKNW